MAGVEVKERPGYEDVLNSLDLLGVLSGFEPTLIGTPPLSVDIATSDIDVACTSDCLDTFAKFAATHFGDLAHFQLRRHELQGRQTVRALFVSQQWPIELFCQTLPISEQHGVRHFRTEKRLLTLEPQLRDRVIELKIGGMKTEPAFAKLLGLAGDPYAAMLLLEARDDNDLGRLLRKIST